MSRGFPNMNNAEIKRCTILVLYDQEGIFDEYVFYLLKELKTVSTRIIAVVNGFILAPYLQRLQDENIEIVIRENKGFDGGAYQDILINYLPKDELSNYDQLIFCNDTFFGPFVPMADIFTKMETSPADFWGITYINWQLLAHLQSYFLVFRKNVIDSGALYDFFNNIFPSDIMVFVDAVAEYEIGLFRYLQKQQFKFDSYCKDLKYFPQLNSYNSIITDNCPILKKKNFSPANFDNTIINNTLAYIAGECKTYSIEYILQMAKRVYNLELRLQSLGDYTTIAQYAHHGLINKVKLTENELLSFIKAHKYIYLYGNGFFGRLIMRLYKNELTNFKGWIASDDYKIEQADLYALSKISPHIDVGIIITLGYANEQIVKDNLIDYPNVLYLWNNSSIHNYTDS